MTRSIAVCFKIYVLFLVNDGRVWGRACGQVCCSMVQALGSFPGRIAKRKDLDLPMAETRKRGLDFDSFHFI
jgi:hypothetical protein